jgi:hypothetical protein
MGIIGSPCKILRDLLYILCTITFLWHWLGVRVWSCRFNEREICLKAKYCLQQTTDLGEWSKMTVFIYVAK